MYFEVKAFNKQVRRFENLDNMNELNEFVADFSGRGYNKFIIKSFDQNGFRKRRFYVVNGNNHRFLN